MSPHCPFDLEADLTHPNADFLRLTRPSRGFLRVVGPILCVMVASCENRTTTTTPPVEQTAAPSVAMGSQQATGFVAGRVLVQFRPGTARSSQASVAQANGAALEREIAPNVLLATVSTGRERTVAATLSRNPNVVVAEPDYLRVFDELLCTTCTLPSDGLFEWQWALYNDGDVDLGLGLVLPTGAVDADIDWLEAFNYLDGMILGPVKIGVLDTGIRASHEDICGKVTLQKNFYDNSSNAADDHGHGTHVAGIAGACADNEGKGVAGVAYVPEAEFIIGKVCAADGTCAVSGIVAGIYWATDQGANVINMSFGDFAQSQIEADALQYAASNNVLMFCAAGNEGVPGVLFPGADPNCVAVTATDYGDELASYSSFGPEAELSAPGGDFEDILFGTSMIVSSWAGWDDDYVLIAGTSMAAPHATGLGAMLYSLGVTDATQIRNCLRISSDDLGSAGWDPFFGWGRINMYNAVTSANSCGAGGGNVPPIAYFTVQCSDFTCDLDGTGSTDTDGTVVSWAWDFGDGGSGSASTTSHTYGAAGTYTVLLTVTDDGGASDSYSVDVSVGLMHVADLEGWSEKSKGNRWEGFLTVLMEDASGSPLAGAQVSVSWTGASTGSQSQSTGNDGVATLRTGRIRRGSSVTFTVEGATHPALSYDSGSNTDADADSDGTTMTVLRPNDVPSAAFSYSCTELHCEFGDESSDPDGSIVSWFWDFGLAGPTSTAQNPSYDYPFIGFPLSYLVTLTVTDDGGASDTVMQLITVPQTATAITLTVTGYKSKGTNKVDLEWDGATGTEVDIYKNGSFYLSVPNNGSHTDVLGRKVSGSFTYLVCLTGSTSCSMARSVTF